MPYFDRFDICEAHYALEIDYNVSGILQERPSNRRRNMSTDYQLDRMGFKTGPCFNGFESLSENGQEIYTDLVERYHLPKPEHERNRMSCDQCEMLSINGLACHETGCPNSGARFDQDEQRWVKRRKCFDCGCTVDAADPCCSAPPED